ncbi:uncharacterized protein [Rutidosis leptorrhynchoides]|uniref:uncharacterized protein isoform X2 n=1 Tax=Rutidosis leptorrhynchoides TaxID=125765 RepID=UPI003A9A2ABC
MYSLTNGQGGQPSGPSRGGGRGFRGGSSSSLRGRGRGGSGGGSVGRGGGGGGRGGGGGGRGSGGRGGGGRGGSSSRGGGRGGRPAVSQPKPQFLARCELCRVDCNTVEVFENHKNGKKHKKNLEIQEEFKRLAGKTQPEIEAMNAAAASEQPPEVKVKDESQTVDSEELLANSMKRKMMEEERNSAEPNKRLKEAVPFICELCDVKCESAPVFDCHLKGRKHLFNLQRFQEQEARLGQVALQALYPALEAALYPVLIQALAQTASTSYPYGGLDQQVLQLLQPYLPQTGPPMYPPGPGYRRHGPNPGVTLQEVESQVEPVSGPESKTGDQEGPENKTEDQVNPENGTKDQVNPENGTKDQVKPENETEDQVEPKNETEGQVEPENETEDQVEPENETEDQVEPEMKTEEVDSNAGESTQ